MTTTNIHYAKTHLSKLVQLAQQGEEIIIVKFNTPMAKIVPITHEEIQRKPGRWKKKIQMSQDFDTTDTIIEKQILESSLFPEE